MRRVLSEHRVDIWAGAFLLFGALGVLGIYLSAGGVFGALVDNGLGITVGLVRFVAPILFLASAVLLWRTREGEDGPTRSVLGVALVLVAATGLLHLLRFDGAARDPVAELIGAGGGLGALAGQPLRRLAGPWGATLLLVGLGALGVSVLTRTTVQRAGAGLSSALSSAVPVLVRAVQSLFRPPMGEIDAELDVLDEADRTPPERPVTRRRRVEASPQEPPHLASGPVDEAQAPPARRAVRVQLPEPAPPATGDESYELVSPAPHSEWRLPPAKLLERSGSQEVDRAMVEERGHVLERALAEHGVETRLVGMVVGPTVTRYELELGPGVKVARVTSLNRDIAYAMATPDVRILAPIPGRQAIGVEVPNARRQLVTVGDILASEEARAASHPLEVAVGRDINGRSVMMNLARMPHLLIAGATGAGKSSCINSLITSILFRSTPEQVRMILIDPKRVELGQYNRLPHLLTQVVNNPKKAANALAWAVREMDRRYDLLAEVGVRDIVGYNEAYDRGDLDGEPSAVLRKALGQNLPDAEVTFPRLPYILVVVDELNDLMMVAARDVEDSICRIAQMARAVGIHLVIATQRPSVNVITGVIKANVPARLAFAVSSLADSRVILDQPGAERLVGRGDGLLADGSSSTPQRIQGAWVTEEEVRSVAAHWRRQAPEVAYVEGVEAGGDDDQATLFDTATGEAADDDDVALFRQARELVVRSQLGSTSMLQRKLRVGFARAGRLMDLLEQQGVVGPSTGSKAREVLMTVDELEAGAGSAGRVAAIDELDELDELDEPGTGGDAERRVGDATDDWS